MLLYLAVLDYTNAIACRYVPQLSGVLITHTPTRFLQDTAVFSADSAFATASVGFECVVWRPKIGQVLGKSQVRNRPDESVVLIAMLLQRVPFACHRRLMCLCCCMGSSTPRFRPLICRKKTTSSSLATPTQYKVPQIKGWDTGASEPPEPNWAASTASCPLPSLGMFNRYADYRPRH